MGRNSLKFRHSNVKPVFLARVLIHAVHPSFVARTFLRAEL
jgi:hypothetical protein